MARGRVYVQRARQRVGAARQRLRAAQGSQPRRGRGRAAGQRRGRGLGPASPMPWDSTAQRESAELGNETADNRVALAASYDRAQRELGFGVGAGDPYSRSAENKDSLASSQRGITNTANNQLYAGSTLNAQSAARSAYDKQQKGLEDAFTEAQTDYSSGTAKTARDEALEREAIKEGAIGRAVAAEPEPLAVGPVGRRVGTVRRAGRGRVTQSVRGPGRARQLNARASRLNARARVLNNRGRGRI